MQRLMRVGVFSVAKIQGAVMAVVGLLGGLIYGAIMLIGGIVTMAAGKNAGIGLVVGAVIAVIAAPILYGVMGFVLGALSAWIYNMAARSLGGIEMHLE